MNKPPVFKKSNNELHAHVIRKNYTKHVTTNVVMATSLIANAHSSSINLTELVEENFSFELVDEAQILTLEK